MKFDLIQIASIVAIVQTILIGLVLIGSAKKNATNSFPLALLVFTYSIMILCSLVLSSGVNHNLFLTAHIVNQSAFLVGPLAYFYVETQLNSNFVFKKKHLLHALPFAIAVAYLSVKFYFIPIPLTCRSNHIMLGSITFAHTLGYFVVAYRKMRNEGMASMRIVSSKSKNQSTWLPVFIYGCASIWLTKLLFFIVWDISGYYQGCNEIINLHFLTLFLLFNTFLYFLLVKPQLFTQTKKYKHSILSDTSKQEYIEMLTAYMGKEKAYRNSLISLKSIAKQLSIGERYLSQIINESFNENFYGFVNRYRIEESKELIRNQIDSSKTILSIAYEVGFNSKSTFNSAFKKYTDYTPKEYREQYRKVAI